MQHRNDDILLFIALGDAAAVATEYVKPHHYPGIITQSLRLDGYAQHPSHREMKPGDYSDDGQRSIAVAETLIESGSSLHTITEKMFIEAFVRGFKRDRRTGYARGYQLFLESVRDANDFKRRIRPDSEKNGACMGVVPVGVIADPFEVLRVAKLQAQTTHDTEIGIFASQAVALMSHFFLWSDLDATKSELGRFLNRYLGREIARLLPCICDPCTKPVLQPATNTVHAVFDLITTSATLSDVLRRSIRLGGDTDSVAAIAVGITSARLQNDIPDIMFYSLEPRTRFGPDFLRDLGKKLMNTFSQQA